MPAPGPLWTSGDGDGRTPDSAGGQPPPAHSAPVYAEAGTGTYDIITRYRMCITYRSGVTTVIGVRRNYVLRARRRVNRRGAR